MDKDTSLAILSRVRGEKQADAQFWCDQCKCPRRKCGCGAEKQADAVSTFRDAATAPLRQQAVQDILRTALLSGGIGAAAGGGVGMLNMLRRNAIRRKRTGHVAQMASPVAPVSTAEDNPLDKMGGWLGDLLSGRMAQTQDAIPWALPGKVAAGMGGAVAGFAGVDALMKHQRKKQEQSDVERAKAEFEQAMAEQGGPKLASANLLGADLDRLYEAFEKAAGLLDAITPSPETQGKLLGGYGAYAVPTGLIAGYAAFKAADKNSQRNVLKKALKLRERRRQAVEPAEIYVESSPSQLGGG